MNDIVKQLHEYAINAPTGFRVYHDAVNEIIYLRAENDRLRKKLEPASPWHDIESAPKDQIILVVSPFYDKSASTKIVAAFLSEGGWLYAEGFEADPEGPIPTHWMPLPEPPR